MRLKAVIVQRRIAFVTAYFMVQISWSKFTISNRVILWPEIHLGHLAISMILPLSHILSFLSTLMFIFWGEGCQGSTQSYIWSWEWEVIKILRLSSVGGIQEYAHSVRKRRGDQRTDNLLTSVDLHLAYIMFLYCIHHKESTILTKTVVTPKCSKCDLLD